MDKPKTTAKDFFLWAGAVVSFYWSVIAYTLLVFDYINYTFPNALSYYPVDPYQSGISFEMASVIVLFPIFVLLMWIIHKDAQKDPSRNEIWVRRWALILTLFIAGIAMAADLITLLTTFLNGEELTTAFLLKVLVVLLVSAGVFLHFIFDLRGYWEKYPARRNAVRAGVAVLALATVIAGFFIVGTPGQARLARFDAQRVNDLQDIQYRVLNTWQAKRALPETLVDMPNELSFGPLPVDPQTAQLYGYEVLGPLTFKLCATFNTVSRDRETPFVPSWKTQPLPAEVQSATQDSWQHAKGEVCFERTIDPSFYPPLSK